MKYDVFISCKSEDYKFARQIYNFLTGPELNYKVFLADAELRKKGKTFYGKVIDAAIEASDHLILVASKIEYITSEYVENEWRLFLEEQRIGNKDGNIVTILKGIDTKLLPISLRHIQSIPLTKYKSVVDFLPQKTQDDSGQERLSRPNWKKKWLRYIVIMLMGGNIFGSILYSKKGETGEVFPEMRPNWKLWLLLLMIGLFVAGIFWGIKLHNESQIALSSHNGHEWVDLGLSVKWATCNIGASNPSEFGDYYAWGETHTKAEYTKENWAPAENVIGDIAGSISDVAHLDWGSGWRLPTQLEIQELIDNCTWIWITQDGSSGFKVTGKNGHGIFLPAAGAYHESVYGLGEVGDYWSSTPYETNCFLDEEYAYTLSFHRDVRLITFPSSHCGFSIRPVLDLDVNEIHDTN